VAQSKLDGPGLAKIAALEEALTVLQRVHGLVEQMAVAMRNGQGAASLVQNIRRSSTPLVGMLKTQFGSASDVAAQIVLVASRASMADKTRLQRLREGVGSLRAQIEAAEVRVRQQHAAVDAHAKVDNEDG
jgi:hypothetical protein